MLQFYLSMLETEEERTVFEQLYLDHRSAMYNIAYQNLHNRNDAEDAVQEAFLRIANNSAEIFDVPAEKRRAFLYTLVKHISIDMFNKNISHKELQYNDEIDSEPEDAIPLDEALIGKLEREALIEFIMSMPPATRIAMQMKYVAGFTNNEIASALEISENTLRQRLFAGRRLIKEYAEQRALQGC